MNISKLILLLTLFQCMVAVPLHTIERSPTTREVLQDSSHKGTESGEDINLPEYMMELYQCRQKHDNEEGVKRCLGSSAGKENGEELTSSNSIIGFVGQGIESEPSNHEPQYQLISFNISCITEEEFVYSSELRVHKKQIESEALKSLSSNICPMNVVKVSLLTDIDNDGKDHIVQSIELNQESLLQEKWLIFRNFNSILTHWMRGPDHHLSNRTVKLVLQGGCAGIHPKEIGIEVTGSWEPLLVVFAHSRNEKEMLANLMETIPEGHKRRRRQEETAITNTTTTSCKLHEYEVNFSMLGWADQVLQPHSYSANYCSGACLYPISNQQNSTLHAKIIALAHFHNPQDVPKPCCVPTKMASQTLMVKVNHTFRIKTYPDMIAKECSCR